MLQLEKLHPRILRAYLHELEEKDLLPQYDGVFSREIHSVGEHVDMKHDGKFLFE